jgi:hypothetical protein
MRLCKQSKLVSRCKKNINPEPGTSELFPFLPRASRRLSPFFIPKRALLTLHACHCGAPQRLRNSDRRPRVSAVTPCSFAASPWRLRAWPALLLRVPLIRPRPARAAGSLPALGLRQVRSWAPRSQTRIGTTITASHTLMRRGHFITAERPDTRTGITNRLMRGPPIAAATRFAKTI